SRLAKTKRTTSNEPGPLSKVRERTPPEAPSHVRANPAPMRMSRQRPDPESGPDAQTIRVEESDSGPLESFDAPSNGGVVPTETARGPSFLSRNHRNEPRDHG